MSNTIGDVAEDLVEVLLWDADNDIDLAMDLLPDAVGLVEELALEYLEKKAEQEDE